MDDARMGNDSTDARIERAKEAALGKHSSEPSHADEASEAVGGLGGMFVGAAIGIGGGPIGILIGGIAGALGGWWSGRAVMEAVTTLSQNEDAYYRAHYEALPNRLADRSFADARPAYVLGHVASHNPEYRNKSWNDVSSDLRRGWTEEHSRRFGDWPSVSRFASEGFVHGRALRENVAPYKEFTPQSRSPRKSDL